jgi:hypothetical protein
MAFANSTGRTKTAECRVCGQAVFHKELRFFGGDGEAYDWMPEAHRAPCGAHCSGGGYDLDETDVHIPAFGRCPRCGAAGTEVVRTIVRPDGAERVVIHRYITDHHRNLGFRVELEVLKDGEWVVKSRWPTAYPESLEQTIQSANKYVPWL